MNPNTKQRATGAPTDLQKGETMVATNVIPEWVRYLTNVAFLHAEILDCMMVNCNDEVAKIGYHLKHAAKLKWRRVHENMRMARAATREMAREIHQIEDADQACEDADYFVDIIYLIADRVGDSEDAQTKLRSMIYNMPSRCGFYEEIQKHSHE